MEDPEFERWAKKERKCVDTVNDLYEIMLKNEAQKIADRTGADPDKVLLRLRKKINGVNK